MCLVVVGWQQHPDFPLIVAGNRDEFHSRPTKEAHWWPDKPDIVGGRDLQAAGTWLALHRNGRFATVTNYRDAELPAGNMRSRGHLVTGFLEASDEPLEYLTRIDGTAYAGFNLLVSDGETLAWLSNRGEGARILPPGVYGLSNALLDSPWHKVIRTKAALEQLIHKNKLNETELLRLLNDRAKAPVDEVVADRLPFATAHSISAPFIVLPDYGTRSSSIALCNSAGSWKFHERRFDPGGKTIGDSSIRFDAGSQA
jgi:uncharacterized protein with NRDE domain